MFFGLAGIVLGGGTLLLAHTGRSVTARVDECTVIHDVGGRGSKVWCYVDVPGLRPRTQITAAHLYPAGASIELRETGRRALTDPATAHTLWWPLPLGVVLLVVGLVLRWPPGGRRRGPPEPATHHAA